MKARTFAAALIGLSTFSAMAGSVTGTIHTLHVNLESNMAHIYLDGQPLFDGGGCSYMWTGNSLDDEKFMVYIWPALMNAKAHNFTVTITTNGCQVGAYPKIVAIDVVPR